MSTENFPLFGEEIFADSPFVDEFEFEDDIHEHVLVNRLERDVVDAPEFQRLFRLEQLGFVDLVYHTANHTRGEHSIGTCAVSKRLVDNLNKNNRRFSKLRKSHCADTTQVPRISLAERVLISLGALLHDVSHGPFSHDIEKKTHLYFSNTGSPTKVKSHYGPYEKHDNYRTNPALYVFLLDKNVSVLARILESYSSQFYELLCTEEHKHPHLRQFLRLAMNSWENVEDEIFLLSYSICWYLRKLKMLAIAKSRSKIPLTQTIL